jgi:hypothetical protein
VTALHVYIDESIRPDGWYRLTAVEVAARDVAEVSRQVRRIVPRGQYRVHFPSEGDARRRKALRALVGLPIGATTFLAPFDRRSDDQVARDACLEALVRRLSGEARVIVIDSRGAHRDRLDRLVLRDVLRAVGRDDVAYSHRGSRDELLLALPDALGWAIGARRPWSQMVAEIVSEVRLR